MKKFCLSELSLAVLIVAALAWGCSRNVPPPGPLTEQELPGVMEQTFGTAKQPQAKELANQVVTAFQAKDYAKAFGAIQALSAVEGLSKEQSLVAGRAWITINTMLQQATSQGDVKSARTLKRYMETK